MLWRSALVMALVMLGLGTLSSFLTTKPHNLVMQLQAERTLGTESYENGWPVEKYEAFVQLANATMVKVLDGDQSFYQKLNDLQKILQQSEGFKGVGLPPHEALPNLSEEQYTVLETFYSASVATAADGPLILRDLATQEEPLPYSNYAFGLLCERYAAAEAVEAYKREAELFDSAAARKRIVRVYSLHEQFERLKELERDPAYQPFITPLVRRQMALAVMDWPILISTLIPAAYENSRLDMVFLAVVTGLIWGLIVLRFNGPFSLRKRPFQLAVPAVLLGALSAHATILFFFWQEHQLGLSMPDNMLGQFLYCLGIGVREEGMKLLCFIPLLPFLRKQTDLEIITIAGLVGLGFAMEENINYFEGSIGVSAVARFVTANFLHISLTALGGLAVARGCFRRDGDGWHVMQVVGLIIVVHGLYDAFIIVEAVEQYAWLSSAVFVFLGHYYFGWLRYLRTNWADPVSATFIFTVGLVFVAGLSYGVCAWQMGAGSALRAVLSEVIGIGVILTLFYREIPETLGS